MASCPSLQPAPAKTDKSSSLGLVYYFITLLRPPLLVTIASLLLACGAFGLSVFGRDIFIDQAYLLLVAQQWTLGRELYVQLGDIHPPPLDMINALPILLSNATGWSIVLSFNLIVSLLAVLSGALVAIFSPRHKFLAEVYGQPFYCFQPTTIYSVSENIFFFLPGFPI